MSEKTNQREIRLYPNYTTYELKYIEIYAAPVDMKIVEYCSND
jgi:hypothetical protein